MATYTEKQLLEMDTRIRPGDIIMIEGNPVEFKLPHYHIFDSQEGVILSLNSKSVVGLFCSCGSILLLD